MISVFMKRKMFIIATCLFLVTMSTVLFVVGEGKLEIKPEELHTFVLQDFNEISNDSETEIRDKFNLENKEFAIVNNKREFIFITPKLESIHGYKLSENVGLNALSLIHPKDLIEFAHTLLDYNKNPRDLIGAGPIRIKTINGKYITYLIDLYPIFNKHNEKIGSIVALKDISTPLGESETNN